MSTAGRRIAGGLLMWLIRWVNGRERWLDQVSDTLNIISMDAATAAVNGLSVVTRSVRDFEGFGAKVVDPFG
jgi:hypothetical protein